MQGGLSKVDDAFKGVVQGYEGIRNRIDDAENRAISKVGEAMGRDVGAPKKLQDQGKF